MFKKFKPTWMVEAIYQITPEQLKAHGIKVVLTDLDNTLIAWNNPEGTKEMHEWMQQMEAAQIPVVVVSNNKEERVAKAVSKLGLPYIARAMKPFAKGFKEAERRFNLPKEAFLMVGDQVMTDIRGANGAGIRTALVKPIVETDAWNTRINRFMERRVMNHLTKKHDDMKWRKTIHE